MFALHPVEYVFSCLVEGSSYARLHQQLLPMMWFYYIWSLAQGGVAYHVQYELVLIFKCKYFLVDDKKMFYKGHKSEVKSEVISEVGEVFQSDLLFVNFYFGEISIQII